MTSARKLWAVVFADDPDRVVPASLAPFEGEDSSEAAREVEETFPSGLGCAWALRTLTPELEAQYEQAE